MTHLETNIFPVANPAELKWNYRLYRIRGLMPEQAEYYQNVQILTRQLSSRLRSPVTVVMHNSEPHLVLKADAQEPVSPFPLVCATAYFDKTGETVPLDFENRTEETEAICLRFLQSSVERALETRPELWHPGPGQPFFMRKPVCSQQGVDIYRGFAVRAVPTGSSVIGVCVDVKHRYVSTRSLPSKLDRSTFRAWRGTNCVYHWGNSWYDVKLMDHSGLSVSEYRVEGKSLLDYVTANAPKPLPRDVAELRSDSAALLYQTTKGEKRAAPADLCYPIFETDDSRMRSLHRWSIMGPRNRKEAIQGFVHNYLSVTRAGESMIRIGSDPLRTPGKNFVPPDLQFGHGVVLSVRRTPDTEHVSLEELGRRRLAALLDREAGPYATKSFDRQYLIWPSSVADSYGQRFLEELKKAVNEMYPCNPTYDPVTIPYNDRTGRTFAAQGRAILSAVDAASREPGYGIAVIHEIAGNRHGGEDQLASMVMLELRKRNLYVSVIHTTMPGSSFVLAPEGPGPAKYQPTPDAAAYRRFLSYLRNVVLTKVLLTNEKWPFVLATPLHADLTVCIDVKLHTACVALVDKAGSSIQTVCHASNQKESLGRAKARTILRDLLRSEWALGRQDVQAIVIQRDGRFSGDERKGIEDALADLVADDSLPGSAALNLVEIPKSSPAPLRLFDVTMTPGRQPYVLDPLVGSYYCPSEREGYLCSTGRPYSKQGTANPLHAKRVAGKMPIEQILEDLYSLSCLAWTRPEGFTRHPVTIKLVDIRLREHGGEYDIDALKYGDDSETEDGNE